MYLYTNKVQQQSALSLCFIVMHVLAMLHQRRGNMYCTQYHTHHSRPQKHCHAVSGNINMHLIFKLQATATGVCLQAIANLGNTSATAILANRSVTNVSRW